MKKIYLLTSLFFTSISIFASTDKYRLVLVDDPATTITIAWNQLSGTNPMVHYGTSDFGTDHTMYPNSQAVDRSIIYRGMSNRFVRLSGLSPNTAYYFVIQDSEGTSERFWFKTAPNDLSRLSFIAGGDSRNNQVPRRRANLLVSKLKPHAVLFGGDMTDDDTNTEWRNWFDDWQLTTANDGRMFPIVPARGNHEGTAVIYNLFDTPNEEAYYALTFGNNLIRTYTLNSEISVSGNQRIWLQDDLESHSDLIWKMAQYHKPMRPHTASKSEGQSEYAAWAPLFFDNGVRLVIDCDSHTAKTTWPVEPATGPESEEGFKINQARGTVYAGEGGWGAPLRVNDDDKIWTRNSGSFNQFKLIFIDENKIELRTIKVDNANTVEEVTNEDPFTLPGNLDLWAPSNGAVVEIFPIAPLNNPDIAFTANTPTVYLDGTDLSLDIEVVEEGNGISNVAFYLDGVLAETDETPPYNFTNSYADGQYVIEAIATTTDNLTDCEQLILNIGSFTNRDTAPVINGDDDVEETETGVVYSTSSDLEIVYDDFDFVDNVPNGYQKIGLRFQNVFIPAGATIDTAYIQFRSDESDDASVAFLILAEDTGNALPFADNDTSNVSARTTLQNSVAWSPAAWPSSRLVGPAQRTSELKDLVQQIVDRSDWKAGNSMVFMIEGTGVSLTNTSAIRVADSYEGSDEFPPTLNFAYSFDASSVLTDIKEINEVVNVPVYPNPFTNTLNFELSKNYDQIWIELIDISGRIIYTQTISKTSGNISINPGITHSGIYFINVYSSKKSILLQQKIIRK